MYYDPDTGELEDVVESNSFKKSDSLLRADVLQDCLYVIEDMYQNAGKNYFNALQQYKEKVNG